LYESLNILHLWFENATGIHAPQIGVLGHFFLQNRVQYQRDAKKAQKQFIYMRYSDLSYFFQMAAVHYLGFVGQFLG